MHSDFYYMLCFGLHIDIYLYLTNDFDQDFTVLEKNEYARRKCI